MLLSEKGEGGGRKELLEALSSRHACWLTYMKAPARGGRRRDAQTCRQGAAGRAEHAHRPSRRRGAAYLIKVPRMRILELTPEER
jgi:hypothetical protein